MKEIKDAVFRGVFFSFDVLKITRSHSATMLWGCIMEFQRNNGFSIATNATLADKSKLCVKSIRQKLNLLEKKGLLEIKQRNTGRILIAKEPVI